MKTQTISIAMASSLLMAAGSPAFAGEPDTNDSKSRQYIGTGIGAVAGALFAGPVGFITGGLIGNLAGKHDTASPDTQKQPLTEDRTQALLPAATAASPESIIVAQANETDPIIGEPGDGLTSKLKDIIINEMEVDVLFMSGSTAVDDYYKQRIQMLSKLLQQMPDIHAYLDGYSDRRGDSDTNLELSNQRLDSVGKQLAEAGVDDSRIHMNAFGEQHFVSSPGDLEAYTFDRRVVVRFGYMPGSETVPVTMAATQSPE